MKPGDTVQIQCFGRMCPFRVKEVWPDGRCLVDPIPVDTPTGRFVPFAHPIVADLRDAPAERRTLAEWDEERQP